MKVKQIQVGELNNIFISRNEKDWEEADFGTAVQKVIDRGHAAGAGVTIKGVKTHHHFEPIVDLSKSGSDQYIWDKSGDRVKGNLVEVTNQKDGSVTKQIIRTTYRTFE